MAQRLSLKEREEIAVGVARQESMRAIARRLGRPASTVSRELKRSCVLMTRYRATTAQERARKRTKRPKAKKLESDLRLREYVSDGLNRFWSPEQISQRLQSDYPTDKLMRVSHETIYKSLFVQTKGSLNKELRAALRTGRARRYPKGANPGRGTRGKLKNMVPISERPAEVEDRAVPGHWEGDLIIGGGHSQIATLVERSTRFVILVRLPNRSAEAVYQGLSKAILKLPMLLRGSLTWDQGREMALHERFAKRTRLPVYFCDPRSPWQRGSNENTNGLLRQYFPKKLDLSGFTQNQLNAVAKELNGRPRETLLWMTPAERMAEVLR